MPGHRLFLWMLIVACPTAYCIVLTPHAGCWRDGHCVPQPSRGQRTEDGGRRRWHAGSQLGNGNARLTGDCQPDIVWQSYELLACGLYAVEVKGCYFTRVYRSDPPLSLLLFHLCVNFKTSQSLFVCNAPLHRSINSKWRSRVHRVVFPFHSQCVDSYCLPFCEETYVICARDSAGMAIWSSRKL